jgi:FkbM family methyltransferase
MTLLHKFISGLRDLPYWGKYIITIENLPTYVLDWLGFINSGKIITYRLRNGIKLNLRASTTDRVIINNILIKNLYMLNREDIEKCHTVIDIGAHIGGFSIFLASLARDIKVYAYEPEPGNYALLLENIKLNRLENKIFPFNYAVSDSNRVIKLYVHNDSIGHSMFIHSPNFRLIEVSSISLDDVFRDNNITKCDLLKINAEGAEYPILLNASEQVLSHIRTICVQCHYLNERYNLHTIKKFLLSKGFKVILKNQYIKAVREHAI